jgi:hypothetical protein
MPSEDEYVADTDYTPEKFESDLKNLYGVMTRVGATTIRDDGRKVVTVTLPNGRVEVNQYSRYLLEIKLGRPLYGDETVDHIDDNFCNDSFDNLQPLSRAENASKGAIGNQYSLGYKQTDEQARRGEKNGMSQINNAEVARYRHLVTNGTMSKEDVMRETGMSDRGVRNFLNGSSYSEAGGPLSANKVGRPKGK